MFVLSLDEQLDELQKFQTLIKNTWLKDYLRFKITHKKATISQPEKYRGWLYAKGYRDKDDGGPAPWLIIPEELRMIDARKLADFLFSCAAKSPEFPHSNEFCMLAVDNNKDALTLTNFICEDGGCHDAK